MYADNLAMYEPGSSPMDERTPPTAATKKGALRAQLAADLLAEHESGRLRVVIGRSSDYFGPGGLNSALGGRFFATLLGGRKTQWFMDLDQPHSVSYLPDLARAFVILARAPKPKADLATPAAAVTGREFIEAARRLAGVTPRPTLLRERTVSFYGLLIPTLGEYPELAYQWAEPFVSDASRFEAAFGPFALTPPRRGAPGDRGLVPVPSVGLPGKSRPDKVGFTPREPVHATAPRAGPSSRITTPDSVKNRTVF